MKDKSEKDRIIYAGAVLPAGLFLAAALIRGGNSSLEIVMLELLITAGYVTSVIDIRTKTVPNIIPLCMLGAWFIVLVPHMLMNTDAALDYASDGLFGAIMTGGVFLLVYIVSRGGVGGGDLKFMTVTGLYLGVYRVLPAILVGSLLSAVFSGILLAMKRITLKSTLPLIPFLFTGILVILVLGG